MNDQLNDPLEPLNKTLGRNRIAKCISFQNKKFYALLSSLKNQNKFISFKLFELEKGKDPELIYNVDEIKDFNNWTFNDIIDFTFIDIYIIFYLKTMTIYSYNVIKQDCVKKIAKTSATTKPNLGNTFILTINKKIVILNEKNIKIFCENKNSKKNKKPFKNMKTYKILSGKKNAQTIEPVGLVYVNDKIFVTLTTFWIFVNNIEASKENQNKNEKICPVYQFNVSLEIITKKDFRKSNNRKSCKFFSIISSYKKTTKWRF